MTERGKSPVTLSRTIAARVILFAGLAMLIQVGIVLADYYFDDTQLAALMVQSETGALVKGLKLRSGMLDYRLPAHLKRYTKSSGDYYTRVRTPEGSTIYSNCDASCGSHLLPSEVNPPDSWSRLLRPGKPIAVAGGRSYEVEGRKVFIEVAVLDDHERVMWRVLGRELADHLAAPMTLMLVFVLGGMLVSVRLVLRPVERAARQAESIDPLDPSHTIDIAGMPREIADLGSAVNRMLGRIGSLMQAQRVYTTAIAHEIRTPLAMMRLELGNVDHPRARKVEADLDLLARLVGQITDLGRLEGADRAAFRPVDLAALARTVVSDIAPWIYDQDDTIAFEDAGVTSVQGHASLIDNAVRNLIENAVKHTPPHTAIQVTAGPGARVSISDDAGLFGSNPRMPADGGALPAGIGLAIVQRIMGLHRGTLETSVEPSRRTTMHLVFARPVSE